MDTEDNLDPAAQEAKADPENADNDQTSEEAPDSGEEAGDAGDDATNKKRLADKDRLITKLQKENDELKKSPKKPEPDDEIDWKIENAGRIKLVKAEYQAELDELTANGAKPTNAIRQKALELAELRKGVVKRTDASENARQAAMSSESGTIDRSKQAPARLTEHDKRLGLTAERKRELEEKYPDLKEGA